MKNKALLTLLLALITGIGASAIQINVDGRDRTYYTYIPAELGNDRPLLISMHGMNQDANYQKGMLQIESVADTAKFAVVFPEGIDRSWDISGTRDINFVLAIIDDMHDRYNIDRNRVYLSGFSMGGMFTYHAINHIADRIAAFAPISGYPMGGQAYTSSRPVPIIHTHGTGDDVVNFSGVQNILNGWIARNGCAPQALVTSPYRGPHATLHQWGPGDDGVEVYLLELADKGHWIANDYFKTGDEIWKFCSRYSLADKHPSVKINHPLPATEIQGVGLLDGMSLTLDASAASEYGDITSVDFYADNQLLGSCTEAPYTFEWTGIVHGSHVVKVVANDSEGNSVARAVPVSAKGNKKNITLSTKFSEGAIPSGWLVYNGRNLRIGEVTGLTGGARCITFTGSPRAFDVGLYFHHITNKADEGYAVYGDVRSTASLYLTEGTYELTFGLCNWERLGAVRCKVVDVHSDETLAETDIMPTVNLQGSAATPFASADNAALTFSFAHDRVCKIVYYTANDKGADAVIANIKLRKVSSEGITDIEANDATAVEVTYFDLMGRALSSPATGLVIRRTTYSNGKVATEKVVIL